ncbi:MAG TPA: amidohydrolase family protein [Mycobacteriales bacterium]|nr:amidohydrolase family protein [Mycobacteriales bacterium]
MTATLHSAPVVLTMTDEPLYDGAVLVEGDRVVAVGEAERLRSDAVRERVWPGVLMPGLVNAHAHLEYGPPFADLATKGLPFPQWIGELMGRRQGMTEQDWQVSARGSAHQLLTSGTTAVADVVTVGPAVQVARSLGLQGISYGELAGVDAKGWPQAWQRLEGILGVGATGISPHTLYTLSNGVFRDLVAAARDRRLRLHPHLAETSDEAEWVLSGTGAFAAFVDRFGFDFELTGTGAGTSPVLHCDALGGLGPDVHVAHGVHVDAADRALLRQRQTVVALCTRSNAILHAGEAPVADYLAEGNPVALGTDSLASSPDLDLLAEARAARDLARRQGFEHPDAQLVRALTLGGAQAVGQDLGTLVEGGRADLAVFDVPVEGDPYAALVGHGAGRCVATVLGGRLVHRR